MEKIQKRQKIQDNKYKVTEEKQLEREKYNDLLKQQLLQDLDESDQEQNGKQQNSENQLPQGNNQPRKDCPYLSTIKRNLIDFDFEKLCSISLNNLNVYACLICSKYYQGRGKGTHAYIHSLDYNHHIFINLHNGKVYCLPDNYEVDDPSLKDIKYNLQPTYSKEQIEQLDNNKNYSRALNGTKYYPGYVGLNNIKCTDYINVMIQSLCRVKDFRNFFLTFEAKSVGLFDFRTLLLKRFGELIRKIWNPKNFKGHVSPHELIQAIILKSKKKFQIQVQSDTKNLFCWFFDNLQKELKQIPKARNIVKDCFEGEIEIYTFKPLKDQSGYEAIPQISENKFLLLTLDIPETPLYEDGKTKQTVPNIPIAELLKKFDGITTHDSPENRKTYRIKKLPKYLVIHMKRFRNNNFFIEKNPTIITFPLTDLDMSPYLDSEEENPPKAKYNLLVNTCHDGQAKGGVFKVHVKNKATNTWFEIQDLHLQEIFPQLVYVSESYIQIWERADDSEE